MVLTIVNIEFSIIERSGSVYITKLEVISVTMEIAFFETIIKLKVLARSKR